MNILVDTSVWSLSLRRKKRDQSAEADQLQELILAGQPIYLIGVILQEILQGLRHREQFEKLKCYLDAFLLIVLNRNNYIVAAELYSTCRRKGIQTSTTDCLIAAAAIEHKCHLFTTDEDFTQIACVSSLKLLKV